MKLFAILMGKMAILAGRVLKRGSSLPGDIALKLDKNLLSKFKLPATVIAVTGSSGKGSTSAIIAHIYRSMGYKVVHNASGANLTAGITTMLLENCSLTGKINADVIVYEMDERYAKYVFPCVKPSHIVVTNITRDQPPRQGDFDLVYAEIKKALPKGCHLVLNGDDPYLLKFNLEKEYTTTYFAINKNSYSYTDNLFRNHNISYCPKCNSKLAYNYYHFEDLGDFYCTKCNFKHPEAKYVVTDIDYAKGVITINNNHVVTMQYDLLYSIYNSLAAFSTACTLGLDEASVCKAINSVAKNSKMYNHYMHNGKQVYVLNNKNENSTTFNQSLLFTKRFDMPKTVVIGWKEISRRYNFDDLSWLYDIDFEILNECNVQNIVCVGPNAYDIATRIKLAGFDLNNIKVFNTLDEAKETVDKTHSEAIFAILNFDYVEPFKLVFNKEE